tara:strand:- start:132 stop:356 length:225 start_codon:yes stop_codon:yes gene_type:complete
MQYKDLSDKQKAQKIKAYYLKVINNCTNHDLMPERIYKDQPQEVKDWVFNNWIDGLLGNIKMYRMASNINELND